MLKPEDYPPSQEPVPPAALAYRAEALRLGAGVEGREVRYGDDLYQRIALFVPPKPNGTVLGYMHGGGWVSGFKEILAFMAPRLMEAGIVFASVGYRLAPKHIWPAGYEDAVAGFDWLKRNAAGFGGDPERVHTGGFSSGGHYAAMLALKLPAGATRGCVAVSGVYDLTPAGGLTIRPRFLGPEGSGSEREASPLLHIKSKPPPFFMAHGDDDFPHLMKQAVAMDDALRAAGGEVERMVLKGRTHFTASLATADPAMPWSRRAIDWMLSH